MATFQHSSIVRIPFSPPILCFIRNKTQAGFHESVFCSLQALRDKEFNVFDETMKKAR